MQRITTLLAFAFCTAAQAQSIEIDYDLDLRSGVALTTRFVGLTHEVSSVPLPAPVQRPRFVTRLMQSLCVPSQAQVPTVTLPLFRCQTSDGASGCTPIWSTSRGVSAFDLCAGIDSLALATDSPAIGPILWLRADAGVTSSAGRVSIWNDLSGQGNHATMATPARQPMLVTGALNGHPVIHFGGAQSMYLTTWVSPTNFTIFVVGKSYGATQPFNMILGPGGQSPNHQLRWLYTDRVECIGQGNNMPSTTSTIGNNRVYHELSLRYDGFVMTIYRDGILASSHPLNTTGPWTFSNVGAYTSLYFMSGDLAEVLIYPTALPEVDRIRTSRYHRRRYAL